MNILVTLDRNYLLPFQTLLTSLLIQHPDTHLDIYLASNDIRGENLADAYRICSRFDCDIHLIHIPDEYFKEAPTIRYYSRAMYYRLLASQFLPEHLKRILYLDPDMLVINPLYRLYEMEMGSSLYAACIHKGLIDISSSVNKVRLSNYETEGYFNSGLLLMNLPMIRKTVQTEEIFEYVKKNKQILILPDQDILNGLYGDRIISIDESLYNYDVRRYKEYRLSSQGEKDMDWVMENTVILHFCGKRKPWHESSRGKFKGLYRHYVSLSRRYADH